MKATRILTNRLCVGFGVMAAGLLLVGCEAPDVYVAAGGAPNRPTNTLIDSSKTAAFQVGDIVTITYQPPELLQPHTEAIKEDGTITPPQLGKILAAGKMPGELESELRTNYSRLYVNLSVTVLSKERYFYVSGEVRRPGATPYLSETDIIKAISNAGDCTDFAKKSKIKLIREGQTRVIDLNKVIKNPAYNVPVYPGDQIVVPRRILW